MSRKHFQAIANELKYIKPDPDDGIHVMAQWRVTVTVMADVCSQFNSAFDRQRFLDACGVNS